MSKRTFLRLASLLVSFAPFALDADPARIEFLRSEVARLDELYHDPRALPEVSDSQYDALVTELRNLETTAGGHGDGSPGSVSADSRASPELPHLSPMRSLQKLRDLDELARWLGQCARKTGAEPGGWMIQPKYDGVALSLTYRHGRLEHILTRGDGLTGRRVTDQVLAACPIPRSLAGDAVPAVLEIRGELFLDWKSFDALNQRRRWQGVAAYTHPRGVVAGIVLSDSDAADPLFAARFVAFAFASTDGGEAFDEMEMLDCLSTWGFPVPPSLTASSVEEALSQAAALMERREQWDFPADGIVVKAASASHKILLGCVASGPAWAAAVKFAGDARYSVFRDFEISVGRTGVLAPVAVFDPVEIEGRSVSRASLNSFKNLQSLGFRPGDPVQIELRGGLIPVLSRPHQTIPPSDLPSIDLHALFEEHGFPRSAIEFDRGRWVLTDRMHPLWIRARLTHFISQKASKIRFADHEMIEKLCAEGVVKEPLDLYEMGEGVLREKLGMDAGEAAGVLEAVKAGRGLELGRLLYGLSIEGVGAKTARRVGEYFGSADLLAEAGEIDLAEVDGLGRSGRQSVLRWLDEEGGRAVLRRASRLGVSR